MHLLPVRMWMYTDGEIYRIASTMSECLAMEAQESGNSPDPKAWRRVPDNEEITLRLDSVSITESAATWVTIEGRKGFFASPEPGVWWLRGISWWEDVQTLDDQKCLWSYKGFLVCARNAEAAKAMFPFDRNDEVGFQKVDTLNVIDIQVNGVRVQKTAREWASYGMGYLAGTEDGRDDGCYIYESDQLATARILHVTLNVAALQGDLIKGLH